MSENQVPKKTKGLIRVKNAFFYSCNGLTTAFKSEAAFRQELVLFIILTVVLFFLPFDLNTKLLLLFVTILVLIVELLNSSIEEIVDLASPNYHKLAKNAKDIASGAVLVSLIFATFVWAVIINNYYNFL